MLEFMEMQATTTPEQHPKFATRNQGASEEGYRMCYKVECNKCGKYTWKGCGKHVASVYDGIEEGKHCTCKLWPGVDTKAKGSTSTTKNGEAVA